MSHLACEQVLWQKFKHQTSKTNVIAKVTANFFPASFSGFFFFFWSSDNEDGSRRV